MSRSRLESLLAAFAALLALWTIATAIVVAHTGHEAMPFWDEWDRWITWLDDGGYTFQWFFEQHNQHRIVLPKLLFAADHLLFHARNWFLLCCTFFFQAITCLLLWRYWMRFSRPDRNAALLIAAILSCCLYSAQQYVNFFWAFQVQFVLVYTAVIGAFFALLKSEEQRRKLRPGAGWLAASIAFAGIATYTMSNGVLIWPVLIAACLWWRMPHSRFWAVVAGALLFDGSFFYHWDRGELLGVPLSPIQRVWHGALFVLTHMGAPVDAVAGLTDNDLVRILCGAIVGAALLTLWTIAIVRAWRRRDPSGGAQAMLLHIGAFLIATSCAFAIGRSDISPTYGFSSRYQTPAYLFWLCLLLAAWPWLKSHLRAATLYVLVCLLLAGGIAAEQLHMIGKVAEHDANFRQGAAAVIAGVFDEEAWSKVYYEPEDALPAAAYLRNHYLGPFTEAWTHWIGTPVSDHFQFQSGCHGQWTGRTRINSPNGSGWRATGWAWDSPPPNLIVFIDAAGKIAGIGRTGLPNGSGGAAAWTAYLPGDPASVTAYILRDHLTLCEIPGARLPR